MSFDLGRDFEESVTCAVCLEVFTEPVELQCRHSLCWACAEQVKVNDHVTCPECRHVTSVTRNPLRRDFKTQRFVDLFVQSQSSQGCSQPLTGKAHPGYQVQNVGSVDACDLCDLSNSVWYCSECVKCMCESCQLIHQNIPGCETHSTRPLTEMHSWAKEKITQDLSMVSTLHFNLEHARQRRLLELSSERDALVQQLDTARNKTIQAVEATYTSEINKVEKQHGRSQERTRAEFENCESATKTGIQKFQDALILTKSQMVKFAEENIGVADEIIHATQSELAAGGNIGVILCNTDSFLCTSWRPEYAVRIACLTVLHDRDNNIIRFSPMPNQNLQNILHVCITDEGHLIAVNHLNQFCLLDTNHATLKELNELSSFKNLRIIGMANFKKHVIFADLNGVYCLSNNTDQSTMGSGYRVLISEKDTIMAIEVSCNYSFIHILKLKAVILSQYHFRYVVDDYDFTPSNDLQLINSRPVHCHPEPDQEFKAFTVSKNLFYILFSDQNRWSLFVSDMEGAQLQVHGIQPETIPSHPSTGQLKHAEARFHNWQSDRVSLSVIDSSILITAETEIVVLDNNSSWLKVPALKSSGASLYVASLYPGHDSRVLALASESKNSPKAIYTAKLA